jgi:hypothetical protein
LRLRTAAAIGHGDIRAGAHRARFAHHFHARIAEHDVQLLLLDDRRVPVSVPGSTAPPQ